MTVKYMLIQLVCFVGTGLYFLSFQCRTNRRLFAVQLLSYAFYITHFLLLGAVTGAISYVINAVRSFCLSSGKKQLESNTMCAVLCVMQVIALVFTWDGLMSALPIIANIASTIAGYSHNPRRIRTAGMFINAPLCMIYSFSVGSIAGVIDELITEASMIVSVIRFGWSDLDRVEK